MPVCCPVRPATRGGASVLPRMVREARRRPYAARCGPRRAATPVCCPVRFVINGRARMLPRAARDARSRPRRAPPVALALDAHCQSVARSAQLDTDRFSNQPERWRTHRPLAIHPVGPMVGRIGPIWLDTQAGEGEARDLVREGGHDAQPSPAQSSPDRGTSPAFTSARSAPGSTRGRPVCQHCGRPRRLGLEPLPAVRAIAKGLGRTSARHSALCSPRWWSRCRAPTSMVT